MSAGLAFLGIDMSTPKADLAVSVLALLQLAKLARDDEMLQQASDLARIETPGALSGLTPRFEAYFPSQR